MDQFEMASSAVLDCLWQNETFPDHFYQAGYDLREAAKLISQVFRDAYLTFRASVPTDALENLQQDVIDELMLQMVRNPAFIDVWRAWSSDYREHFLDQQSEQPLAVRLAQTYPEQAARIYKDAFDAWLEAHPHAPE